MAFLQRILPVFVVSLLRLLLSWFRSSNREEDLIQELEGPENPPKPKPNGKKPKAKGKKGKPFKDSKPDPPVRPVLPEPQVPSTPLYEFFRRYFTDEQISAVREKCESDDEAFKKLNAMLPSLDQFQEVKPQRGRRDQLEALGSNASSSNTDAVTIDERSNVETAPAQESFNVDAENTRENPLVAPSVTSQELEAQGSNASGSNTDEVTIDAGSYVELAPAQGCLNVGAENMRENPLVAPSVTSSPCFSNAMIAMNEQPSYNRNIAGAGSLVSPSIWPTTIRAPRPLGSKNFAKVVSHDGYQATVSHMVGETSPTSPLSEVFRESQEVQVSERNVASENSSSNITESNGSYTGEEDTCKVEVASQSNDGSVEDMASRNLRVEENERHEVGPRSSNYDIPATALSSDQLTLEQEDKEVSSLPDNTSTTVLPERVQSQDADFSHLSSYTVNSDVNTAIPSNKSDPVKNNLNDGSANLNGSSGNNSTLAPAPAMEIPPFRKYHPLYGGQGWELTAPVDSFLSESYRSSLTGHNAASSLQQSYLGAPHFPNTSGVNFCPYGNMSAQTNSPRIMLENFSNVSNRSGTGFFDVQRAQENDLAMAQQYQSGLRALPTSGQAQGRSPSIQGSRFLNSNQQLVLDIQRQNQLQLGIPDDRFSRQILDRPFLPVQSDLPGSRHQTCQGQTHLLSRSYHFPQASSTALLPTNPDNFPLGSSNQSFQGRGQGRVGIIGPSKKSPGQSQGSSQSDAAFRSRDAGSSTAIDRRYELFSRPSQPLRSSSMMFSTSLCQNLQGQEEKPSEGDDAFPDPQSSLPPGLSESSSDRTQGSSEEHKQP